MTASTEPARRPLTGPSWGRLPLSHGSDRTHPQVTIRHNERVVLWPRTRTAVEGETVELSGRVGTIDYSPTLGWGWVQALALCCLVLSACSEPKATFLTPGPTTLDAQGSGDTALGDVGVPPDAATPDAGQPDAGPADAAPDGRIDDAADVAHADAPDAEDGPVDARNDDAPDGADADVLDAPDVESEPDGEPDAEVGPDPLCQALSGDGPHAIRGPAAGAGGSCSVRRAHWLTWSPLASGWYEVSAEGGDVAVLSGGVCPDGDELGCTQNGHVNVFVGEAEAYVVLAEAPFGDGPVVVQARHRPDGCVCPPGWSHMEPPSAGYARCVSPLHAEARFPCRGDEP